MRGAYHLKIIVYTSHICNQTWSLNNYLKDLSLSHPQYCVPLEQNLGKPSNFDQS